MNSDLHLLTNVSEALADIARCEFAYVTAELEPYSSQRSPNLLVKANTAAAKRTLFVEYRHLKNDTLGAGFLNSLSDRVEFVSQGFPEIELDYVIISDAEVPAQERDIIACAGISLLQNMAEPKAMADRIAQLLHRQQTI